MVIDKTSEEFKEKKRQISREWYKNNKEKKAKYMKEYFKDEEHRIKNTKRYEIWRKEHKKEYNKRQRDYMRKRLGIKPENYYKEKKEKNEEILKELEDEKEDEKDIKGCGRMLAISSDRDCGAYCPFCKKIHYCVFCGGGYELHIIELEKENDELEKENDELEKENDKQN